MDLAGGRLDVVDPGLAETDPGVQLPVARADESAGVREPERDAQQPGLADMVIVLVDHDDLGVARTIRSAQPVGRDRSARSAAQNHDRFMFPTCRPPGPSARGVGLRPG
jgi:hypothetical protein